jgi:hypothetical protein
VNVVDQAIGTDYVLYQGDCVSVVKQLPSNSVDLTVYSPPFSNLYVYSDSMLDMGNSADDDEFFAHYGYLIDELYRLTKPGRISAVHCKQLVNYKGRDGMAGLRDFRGEIIRRHVAAGWAYHSEVCIWTDPVLEMQRTKSHGLLYKQLRADSTFSRQGLPEYVIFFRKWAGESDEIEPVTHTRDEFPLDQWQQWASPVWMDIRRTDVLNVQEVREEKDEKHIAPLQLSVIERAIGLYTNPGDVVLDPFNGIGSSGYMALKMRRRYVGIELKPAYWNRALVHLERALEERNQLTLFDMAALS